MGILQKIANNFKNSQKPSIEIVTDDRIMTDDLKQQHLVPAEKWHSDMKSDEIKAFPLINEPMAAFSDTGVFVHPFGVPPPVDYGILWTYFKYTPELIAIVRAIVEDIMSDGWFLDGGRNNRLKVEEFLMENNAKEQISSLLFDVMVTGDGYLYVQKISKNEVKSVLDKILNRNEIKSMIKKTDETKHELGTTIFTEIEKDEQIFQPKSFVNLPSSTLKAQFDKNGEVYQWIQKVGIRIQAWKDGKLVESMNEREQNYNLEEIIHFRLLRLDGKFYGFSPMASILKEMDILANVKDYARYFFEKGGVPNYMFILANETPQSENYKAFKKTLQLFASLANKYKSMVVTGEVKAEALNKLSRDMEFRDLAKYLTQILIMAWGVPTSRLSDIGLGDRIQSRGSTISTEGYYRKISHIQDLLEDMINTKLLAPFNVKMHFKKTYLQDEIREVQVDKIKTDTAEQRMMLGMWSREQAGEYLGLHLDEIPTEEQWQKLKEMLPAKQGWGTQPFGQSKLNNMQTLSESSEKIGQNADKQAAALNIKSEIEEIQDRLEELEDKKTD